MTESTTLGVKFDPFAKPTPAEKPEVLEVAVAVSANVAGIQWPSDKWGYTSKLRKEFTVAASTVKGQADKQAILLHTLDLMRGHLIARFKADAEGRVHALARIQAATEDRNRRGLR